MKSEKERSKSQRKSQIKKKSPQVTSRHHYSLGMFPSPILIVLSPHAGLVMDYRDATSGAPQHLHAGLVIGFFSDSLFCIEHHCHQRELLLGLREEIWPFLAGESNPYQHHLHGFPVQSPQPLLSGTSSDWYTF